LKLRRQILASLFCVVIAATTPLLAQLEHPAEKIVEDVVKEGEKPAAEKTTDDLAEQVRKSTEDWQKYQEEQKKYYERYATTDREYFGWFASAELKKPFNQVVDDAIVSIRSKSGAKVFKNAGNRQIVEALSAESQALPPPDRLNLELQESWYKPDTLEVTKPGSSESASVRMGSLKDYISDAIDSLTYPPTDPSKVVLRPNKAAQKMRVVPSN
jgi:polyhydroxyalkanoate synthesis regulator phasin